MVLEVASQYVECENKKFDAIIFASAKEEEFQIGGQNNQVFQWKQDYFIVDTLEKICETIGDTLEYQTIRKTKGSAKIKKTFDILREKFTLLIVDNLDTIKQKEKAEIITFIEQLSKRVPNVQIMVTSRERIVRNSFKDFEVTELSKKDSLALIEQQLKNKNKTLTNEQKQEIFSRFQGVPLALIFAIGFFYIKNSLEEVLEPFTGQESRKSRCPNSVNELTCYCFERSVQVLKNEAPYAYQLFLAFSIFSSLPTHENALKEVAGLETESF